MGIPVTSVGTTSKGPWAVDGQDAEDLYQKAEDEGEEISKESSATHLNLGRCRMKYLQDSLLLKHQDPDGTFQTNKSTRLIPNPTTFRMAAM